VSTVFKVGDKVRYHGSRQGLHGGVFTVVFVPPDPAQRGYGLERWRLDEDRYETLRDVHPRSFTRLDDKSEEGAMAAATFKELLEIGYDKEYLEGIPEFIPDLLEGIKDGVFDSYIKAIAAACLDRRDVLAGKPGLRAAMVTAAAVKTNYDGQILGEDGVLLGPVMSTYKTIEINEQRYSKDDMVGRHLRLRKSVDGLPWYLDQLLVKVVSVGNAYIVVEAVEDPRKRHPNSTELEKKKAGVGYQIRIDPENILHIFG
jgi:hypothetical protein